jgi:hypothetical protein
MRILKYSIVRLLSWNIFIVLCEKKKIFLWNQMEHQLDEPGTMINKIENLIENTKKVGIFPSKKTALSYKHKKNILQHIQILDFSQLIEPRPLNYSIIS